MPEGYLLHDAQLIQQRITASAANALHVAVGPVPAGKIWTLVEAFGTNDVVAGETEYCWFAVDPEGSGVRWPITRPVSQLVKNSVGQFFPCLTEGMEIKLWPGDYLEFCRGVATAGSTCTIRARFIETDMPLYEYIEPQERKRLDIYRTSVIRQVGGGGGQAGRVPVRTGPPSGPRGRGI